MSIKRQDPILKAMRMSLIKRIRDMKVYKEEFDYQNIEWTLSGSNYGPSIEIRVQLDENFFWINLKVHDADEEMDREQMKEFVDELIPDPIQAEFNDQDQFDDGVWYFTYTLKFKDHNTGLLTEKMKLLAENVTRKAVEGV
jgi:hypothetical protein